MRSNLEARTEWETEAARRRELIESDAAARRLTRSNRQPAALKPATTEKRRVRWSDLARSFVNGR